MRAELSRFAGRGSNREITPVMIEHLIGLQTKCHESVRQCKNSLDLLSQSLPSAMRPFDFPSRGPIHKVCWSLPSLNDLQSACFLRESASLCLCFDGSTKMNESIFAVSVVNECGNSIVLDARVAVEHTSTANADAIMNCFSELSIRVNELDSEIVTEPWGFAQETLAKVTMIMSDSCAEARKTRKNVAALIKEAVDNDEQVIILGDCSMHAISNMEKHMWKSMSAKAKESLSIVNQVLASRSLDSLWREWHMEVNNDSKLFFVPEIGTRFGHRGGNAAIIVIAMPKLVRLCKVHPENTRLQSLLECLQDPRVVEELFALAIVWHICLAPMWEKLRSAPTKAAIELFNSYIKVADRAVTSTLNSIIESLNG